MLIRSGIYNKIKFNIDIYSLILFFFLLITYIILEEGFKEIIAMKG